MVGGLGTAAVCVSGIAGKRSCSSPGMALMLLLSRTAPAGITLGDIVLADAAAAASVCAGVLTFEPSLKTPCVPGTVAPVAVAAAVAAAAA
eukprot:CAMPEP_0202378876 /NCGR_PEP_ID=MMETSP1127-20130417/21027_1 /ASSEMBLY_ACC=CAM_ASM_000462 /TAXON_ID=3047 /ORGANISM="Dunaliella tertiolecta, Strain CCMP1320" /LENGTH=90 /DNA_ID=CAMNT_0048977283 /DNA_START=47 /DNA_END=315 /DNA_ORIENTATION=+